ncbi:DUF417 family protein [Chitinophaga rhizosphaerae]|uniref:DUF417 family protein n=1 Tax=Chitinophaga rhizosphaerae TaxID=1864947 RepID=UPI000F800608|nr:DUF417 family protein [Chitinophaga rhizosphaerae]
MKFITSFLAFAARLDKSGIRMLRIAVSVILIWIGALKFVPYEAEGITPFVANSPFMRFFYQHPDEYGQHRNKEGEVHPANIAWHEANNTYGYAYGLGILLVGMGVLLLLNRAHPLFGTAGALLTIIMGVGTLSFLVTTPETWVPGLGGAHHGFPYLSAAGRLVLKDLIMLAGAVVLLSDSAKAALSRLRNR